MSVTISKLSDIHLAISTISCLLQREMKYNSPSILMDVAAHVKTITDDLTDFQEGGQHFSSTAELKLQWQARLAKLNEKLVQAEYQRSSKVNKLNSIE